MGQGIFDQVENRRPDFLQGRAKDLFHLTVGAICQTQLHADPSVVKVHLPVLVCQSGSEVGGRFFSEAERLLVS